MCHDTFVQDTEQLWAASLLSFHHVGSRDQTQVIRFGSKHFDSPRAPVQFLEPIVIQVVLKTVSFPCC